LVKEPHNMTFLMDFVVRLLTISTVCDKDERVIWLTKCENILNPLIISNVKNHQLTELWQMMNDLMKRQ